jgi:hypothetical protein
MKETAMKTLAELKAEGAPPEMRPPRWEEGQGIYIPVNQQYFDWYWKTHKETP